MTGAIIQARMGSARLPGKVLMPIGEKPLLWHVVERLKRCKTIKRIVLATTELPEDDVLETFTRDNNIIITRGSSDNVLSRFIKAAHENGISTIVRICADSPFIDWGHIDSMVEIFNQNDFSLLTVDPNTCRLLDGIEVVMLKELETLKNTQSIPYKEHVTLGIKEEHPEKVCFYPMLSNLRRTDFRIVIDTHEDYERCMKIQNAMEEKYHTLIWPIESLLTLNSQDYL